MMYFKEETFSILFNVLVWKAQILTYK